ncbi:MAG: response regulator [Thermoplasmatota archaeon]
MRDVLLVEDSEGDARLVSMALRERGGWRVTRAGSVAEALASAEARPFDAALVDYRLPDGDGLALLPRLRAARPEMPLIFLTGVGTEEIAMTALSRGAADYLVKDSDYASRLARRLDEVLSELPGGTALTVHVAEPGSTVAPMSSHLAGGMQPPTVRRAPEFETGALAKLVAGLVRPPVLAAAIFDAAGRSLASSASAGVSIDAIGPAVLGLQFQAQLSLRQVDGAGPPRVTVVSHAHGLLAAATAPGPLLVVLVCDVNEDASKAAAKARGAAEDVWRLGGG